MRPPFPLPLPISGLHLPPALIAARTLAFASLFLVLAACQPPLPAGEEPTVQEIPPAQTSSILASTPVSQPTATAKLLLPVIAPGASDATPFFDSGSNLSPTPTPRICSPLAEHPLEELPEIISDPYHPPPPGKEERHHGVDFSYYRQGDRLSIQGEVVQSVLAGQVAAALDNKFPYGNMLIIETSLADLPVGWIDLSGLPAGESMYILYAHLENPPGIALGDRVDDCQPLSTVGRSGNAGVAHLHIETRIGPAGTRFTSLAFYDVQATQEEKDNYILWRTSGVFLHFDPMRLMAP